jgi:hypothetical protein
MWISLWILKGTTAVNGLKTLKPPVDSKNRKNVVPIHTLFKTSATHSP